MPPPCPPPVRPLRSARGLWILAASALAASALTGCLEERHHAINGGFDRLVGRDARVGVDAGPGDSGFVAGDANLLDGGFRDARTGDGGVDLDARTEDGGFVPDGGFGRDVGFGQDGGLSDFGPPECEEGTARRCEGSTCVQGIQRCEGGRWSLCEGPPERCNELDDDCDGEIDEDFNTGDICQIGGEDECVSVGRLACDGLGDVFCDARVVPPGVEVCDGFDNDCDERVDEGFGLGERCIEGEGACVTVGQFACAPDGESFCDAPPPPSFPEACDGRDNDCDGFVDEDTAGRPCVLREGTCISQGREICLDGALICDAPPPMRGEEQCNGQDDDCDGRTDEDTPGAGRPCRAGNGVCVSEGQFICARGELICDAEPPQARPERCNGEDEDCDGRVDEGTGGDPCRVQAGVCVSEGLRQCLNGELICDAPPPRPRPEICNGQDDDCDGEADEGFGVGRRCLAEGEGQCSGVGEIVCNDAGEAVCSGQAQAPQPEICDGEDNDCNGRIDDVPGVGRACNAGQGRCARPGRLICGEDDGFGGGLAFAGVRTNLSEVEAIEGGFEICYRGAYSEADEAVAEILADCDQDILMMACKPEGAPIFQVAAMGQRDFVLRDMGRERNPVNHHNGVNWYFNDGYSWGFVPEGETPNRSSCDTRQNAAEQRLCWHTSNGNLRTGWRCGATTGLNNEQGAGFERIILQRRSQGLICDAQPGEPAVEQCNAVDDDCDGTTDEGLGGDPCEIRQGQCTSQGRSTCVGGEFICEGAPPEPLPEQCNAADDDCDGRVDEGLACAVYQSCQDALRRGERQSGIYRIQPRPDADPVEIYCDQTTDGGGWTLVVSTRNTPPDDRRGGWHNDLTTLAPAGPNEGVWDGLRALSPDFDVRFACRDNLGEANAPMTVDLSMYDTQWYPEWTTGTDQESCFSERNGQGQDLPPPARRNNLNGDARPRGDNWDAGFLEGEDNCGSQDDFTVDFDNRGMDANQSDGTDWGEDDRAAKCGRNGVEAGQWFIFVRELTPACERMPPRQDPEQCDGLDEDCDGVVDEGFGVGARCTAGVGACETVGIQVCGDNGDVTCDAQPGRPQAEICDGIDNDCDGATDEEVQLGACEVREGQCSALGAQRCVDGAVVCEGEAPVPADEACNGADDDCDGRIDEGIDCRVFRTCQAAFDTGVRQSGAYLLNPLGGEPVRVWCDMTTDGGGWTLVASTRRDTLNDQASNYYPDLTTLAPARGNAGVWNGLRGLANDFDVRFACRAQPGSAPEPMTVDLSIYDTQWYPEWTTGTDAESCFSEENGQGEDLPPPARRNNLTGEALPRGDAWNAGFLEGEDRCQDAGDFTVDFDNRGMDSNESDGTDWGEDDNGRKCGQRGLDDGQWFIYVRELPAPCDRMPPRQDPEICDAVDNDCDGRADEGLGLGSGCAAGEGQCARDGVLVCGERGEVICSAEPGEPVPELCNELDDDCDGRVDENAPCGPFRSCLDVRQQGFIADGVYRLQPSQDQPVQEVYCDQNTDGGGWTLVASTRQVTLNDQASPYYADLTTLAPADGHEGVWRGMRGVAERFDVRFACRREGGEADAPMTVDLSMYSTPWYTEWTTGTDAQSCFSEQDGRGQDQPPPARRNNLTGERLPVGTRWQAERGRGNYLEGEDSCQDAGDFTVDFRDRGMDSNENDGTDWGEDDDQRKCGQRAGPEGQWFLFVREAQ